MMNKQVQIYCVDTNSFYSNKEKKFLKNEERVNRRLKWFRYKMKIIKEYVLYTHLITLDGTPQDDIKYRFNNLYGFYRAKKKDKDIKKHIKKLMKTYKTLVRSLEYKELLESNRLYMFCKNEVEELSQILNNLIESYKDIRILNPKKVSKYNIVSLFDSYLTRSLNLEYNKLTTDLIIIKIKPYSIMKQLIEKGCEFLGEHYRFFTASAGQIRKKKILMIKEKVWKQYAKTLMCGLTEDDINKRIFPIDNKIYKGCNINKYLSYLALCTGATDKWGKFDIDKAIVIDDFETEVEGEVDYINSETFLAKREPKKISITFSDGCGWILPSVSKKNFMVRLPWFKGLLTPVDYLKWCELYNNSNYKITDIYGKEWDLLEDGIKYVFSKSQFKMWKYYSNKLDEDGNVIKYGWDMYKENFKSHNCHASICNIEPNKNKFKKKHLPYQMWQTLTDVEQKDIDYFTKEIIQYITNAYTQRDFMLDILGATLKNLKKTYLQQALEIYPELLKDPFLKHELSEIINSKKRDAKRGKFPINDAKYTFILPDVFAWLQFSLGGDKNPKGLLNNNEVSCKLYEDEPKIIVLRNPHLYREWAVKENIVNYTNENWFTTNGVYTGCHDLVSKLLMFDNDGDTALIVSDHRAIEIAEKNMKGNISDEVTDIAEKNKKKIVPLYYEMGVANPQEINANNIYNSLVIAFKYGNIGEYSNTLTRIWNSEKPDLELIKAIVALNNFSIDAAKTLYMPKPKGDMATKIKEAKKLKLPYFFQFVKKDYKEDDLAEINDFSTVNLICKRIENIPQQKFDFSQVGTFRYDNLLANKKIQINPIVIEEYKLLNEEMQKYFYLNKSMEKEEIGIAIWDILQYDFSVFCEDNNIKYTDAVDMIIKYMYNKDNRTSRKEFIFNVFGDVIVENIQNNIGKDSIICSKCNRRTKKSSNRQTMCESCANETKNEKAKLGMRKSRQKKKLVNI